MARRQRAMVVLLVLMLGAIASGASSEIKPAGDSPQVWSGDFGTEGPADTATLQTDGARVYAAACAVCHGATGTGDGPGAPVLSARPRDFTRAQYRVRSTESGELPSDEDLYRTISVGFPEYGMPRFAHLSPEERWALVAHIKSLSPRFADEEPAEPLDIPEVTRGPEQSIERGRKIYERLQCAQCHGPDGRGDGPSSHIMVDEQGYPSRTRNFHVGVHAFKRGGRAEDVVATMVTGMDGTPMPSYEDVVSDDDLAAVACYIESLTQEP